jgi:hypothetical protein
MEQVAEELETWADELRSFASTTTNPIFPTGRRHPTASRTSGSGSTPVRSLSMTGQRS